MNTPHHLQHHTPIIQPTYLDPIHFLTGSGGSTLENIALPTDTNNLHGYPPPYNHVVTPQPPPTRDGLLDVPVDYQPRKLAMTPDSPIEQATTKPISVSAKKKATKKTHGTKKSAAPNSEDRVIATIQTFQGGKWGPEQSVTLADLNVKAHYYGTSLGCWTYQFERGGTVSIFPQFATATECQAISSYVLDNPTTVLRQYPIRGILEPRLHGLLDCQNKTTVESPNDVEDVVHTTDTDGPTDPSTTTTTTSYAYHGIKMKALGHVSDLPALERVADRAATVAGIQDGWNIGCDVIVYRNPYDKIGWHADDTQEESCIFSVIAQSEVVRPLYIAPKGSDGRVMKQRECQEGLEKLRLYVAAGDAYTMDGELQKHYVHSLPRVNTPSSSQQPLSEKMAGRRIALIFRHGRKKHMTAEQPDKGLIPSTLEGTRPATVDERHPFGPMRDVITEGEIYSRTYLGEVCAFSCAQGGISGTKEHGCSAIVVSRQSPDLHEGDTFLRLWYSSKAHQQAGALYQTYTLQKNHVRVFRSTALAGHYGALDPQVSSKKQTSQRYRYDGLYEIVDCVVLTRDAYSGLLLRIKPSRGPQGNELYTFELKRVDVGSDRNAFSTKGHLEQSVARGTMDESGLAQYRLDNSAHLLAKHPSEHSVAQGTRRKARRLV